jgi:CRP/FNR family transcriptional regulator, cyclic AMP receptor protein
VTPRSSSPDREALIAKIGLPGAASEYRAKQIIFSQGDPANSILYILKGGARLSVLSPGGKEAVIAMLGADNFLGEGCLAGERVRMTTATAVGPTTTIRIDPKTMARILHEEHTLSDVFIRHLLLRNIRVQADLVDQLFNSSEKRLARALLLIAHYGNQGETTIDVPKISQETLAEMIGTTRSRVSFFMNKFRKLGFIEYNGTLRIHKSLLSIVLHE